MVACLGTYVPNVRESDLRAGNRERRVNVRNPKQSFIEDMKIINISLT